MRSGATAQFWNEQLPFLLVAALFAVSIWFVPWMAQTAINDDWIYTKTVEHLIQTGEMRILNMSVASLVFQAVWGGLFAFFSDNIFAALRLSTLTITLISGFFLNLLLLELGIAKSWRVVGLAAYLFNPLAYVLSFTFMTDMHLTAMLTIGLYFFTCGAKQGIENINTIVASIVTGLAFLIRQPAVFFLAGVVAWLIFSGQISFRPAGLRKLSFVLLPAALIMGGYHYWLVNFHGVPLWQTVFASILGNINPLGVAIFAFKFTNAAFIYLALFIVPFTLAALPQMRQLFWQKYLLFLVADVTILWLTFSLQGMRMPYLPHFFNRTGLGPSDLVVSIPPLILPEHQLWLSVVCFVLTLPALALIYNLFRIVASQWASPVYLLGFVLVGLIAAALLPSLGSADNVTDGYNIPGLERYLLPALPVMICLALLSLKHLTGAISLAWAVLLFLGLFAVAGTHDSLAFQREVWRLAQDANQMGIENTHLDGGAAWDGYHLFDNSLKELPPAQTPGYSIQTAEGALIVSPPTWWHRLWAPATDSRYVIAGSKVEGFEIIKTRTFVSWLRRRNVPIYLLRRPE